jgi:hypothetical protein
MQDKAGEPWRKLCERAAVEQDSDKLLELTAEINRILEEHEVGVKVINLPLPPR